MLLKEITPGQVSYGLECVIFRHYNTKNMKKHVSTLSILTFKVLMKDYDRKYRLVLRSYLQSREGIPMSIKGSQASSSQEVGCKQNLREGDCKLSGS